MRNILKNMCIHKFKDLKATRLLVLFIIFYGITVKTRLLQGSETSETRLLQDERGFQPRDFR